MESICLNRNTVLNQSACVFALGYFLNTCISVYNFTAQGRASSGNQSILNFRVMLVRDTKLRSHLSKNIYLSHDL